MKLPRFCPVCGTTLGPRVINALDRLACIDPGCGYVFWDNPVPVVAAIVEHDDAIVLANNCDWPAHLFGLVTGFLERHESPADAVRREVLEELGLECEIRSLVGLYPFEKMNQLIIAYHVCAGGVIHLGEELRSYKLVPRRALKPWPFGTGLAVRDWLAAQGLAVDE